MGRIQSITSEEFIINMKQPALFDGERIYNPEVFSQKLKFTAIGLGK
ncbi:MAG: hypothetical protein ABSD42_00215 [Candidatus Bathyarchaeia archaeon]|jgi:hypothetical protein